MSRTIYKSSALPILAMQTLYCFRIGIDIRSPHVYNYIVIDYSVITSEVS